MRLNSSAVTKGGKRKFAAGAKALGQFPQTGHSPRNGENQPANDWVADKDEAARAAMALILSVAGYRERCAF